MKLKHFISIIVLTSIASSCCVNKSTETAVYLDENQPIDARVEDALARMTLEEKVKIHIWLQRCAFHTFRKYRKMELLYV